MDFRSRSASDRFSGFGAAKDTPNASIAARLHSSSTPQSRPSVLIDQNAAASFSFLADTPPSTVKQNRLSQDSCRGDTNLSSSQVLSFFVAPNWLRPTAFGSLPG